MKNSVDLHSLGGVDHSRMQELLGYCLAQAAILTETTFDNAISKTLQLRQVEFTVMTLIDSNALVTQKKLSVALAVAAPNLTVILDKMEARGLLKRIRSEEDRRIQHLELTTTGRTTLKKAWSIATGMEADILSHLSNAERVMLFELLMKVAHSRKSTRIAS